MFDASSYYMRSASLVAVTSSSAVILVSERGDVLKLPTPGASQWSALLQSLSSPRTADEVGGLAASLPDLDRALWERLLDQGYIARSRDRDQLLGMRELVFRENHGLHFVTSDPVCDHLVLACTGSVVSGLIAPTILSLYFSRFQRELDVILTASAQRFLTRDLLEAYGIRTWADAFERRQQIHVAHVQLGRSADCILVMPATANSLHRIASGACTDLLSTTVAASDAPVVLVPAMNEAMWNNRAVQRNVHQLRDDGMYVVEPTLIFAAADLPAGSNAMYGGHGTLWAGPRSLLLALSAVLRDAARLDHDRSVEDHPRSDRA